VASIEECLPNTTFLLESKEGTEDICEFVSFPFGCTQVIFVIERLISYGKTSNFATLVNIDAEDDTFNQKINASNSANVVAAKIVEKDAKDDVIK
jgi:hypothetical protein